MHSQAILGMISSSDIGSTVLPNKSKGPISEPDAIINSQFLLPGLSNVCKSFCLYIKSRVMKNKANSTIAIVRLLSSKSKNPNFALLIGQRYATPLGIKSPMKM